MLDGDDAGGAHILEDIVIDGNSEHGCVGPAKNELAVIACDRTLDIEGSAADEMVADDRGLVFETIELEGVRHRALDVDGIALTGLGSSNRQVGIATTDVDHIVVASARRQWLVHQEGGAVDHLRDSIVVARVRIVRRNDCNEISRSDAKASRHGEPIKIIELKDSAVG